MPTVSELLANNISNAQTQVDLHTLFIDVKSYGAKGDVVTDDTIAIQTAVSENPGKTLYFPEGIYRITDSIHCSAASCVNWMGPSSSLAALYCEVNIPHVVMDTTAGDIYYASFDGIRFESSCVGTRTGTVGIEVIGTHGLRRSKIENCWFRGTYTGIYMHTSSVSDWNIFDNLLFDNVGGYSNHYCIRWYNCGGQATYSNLRMFAEYAGIYADGASGSFGDSTFVALNHDGGTYGIYVDGTGMSYRSNFNITGNKFDNVANPIYLKNCDAFRIIGNSFLGGVNKPVTMITCDNYVVDSGAYNQNGMSSMELTGGIFLGNTGTGGAYKHERHFILTNKTAWSTILTLTQNVSGIWTGARIKVTIVGAHIGEGSGSVMTISEKFLRITDATLSQVNIAEDWESDSTYSPKFRVNISDGLFQLQMQSFDGVGSFHGTMFVEMWLGNGAGNAAGFTWLIS